MNAGFLDYELPERLIAQHPAEPRDSSRLMVVHRSTRSLQHRIFRDLPDLLNPGDLLVVNDSRVLPARLIGRRESTGGRWEGLYLRAADHGWWEMLARTKGKPAIGEAFVVDDPAGRSEASQPLRLYLRGRREGHWLMEPEPAGDPSWLLARHGRTPLPPYIRGGKAEAADAERYQTVYARVAGSAAAPTAGLHFTPELLERLRERHVATACVTLHAGLGTFEPIRAADPTRHAMHHEWAEASPSAVAAIEACKSRGGRAIAVGTTAARTLESAAADGSIRPWQGETGLFIQPGYRFRVIDALITNFHLPRTTLLLLVAAFAGGDLIRQAYETAVRMEYRFYSYGDAMLIV